MRVGNDDAATRPGGPGGDRGMLSLSDLESEIADGTIDTVVTAFTDMQGRLFGKRITGEYFLDEVTEHAIEGCDYLLALDMEMEPIPGYDLANWEKGYGDFEIAPDLSTLRRIPWLDRTALVLCDVVGHDGEPVVRLPAPGADPPVRARPRDGVHADDGLGARVLPLQGELRRGPREGLQRPHADDPLHPRLPRPRHDDGRAVPRPDPPRHVGGRASRSSSRRARPGTASTRSTPATPTRSPRPTATRSTRTASRRSPSCNGISATFMAKPSEKDIGSSCHIHTSLVDGRRQERVRRRRRGERHLPPLHRRPARPHPRPRDPDRAVDQLLQALRGRELGADLDLMGPRQPHVRLPRRRPRPVDARRVPHPRRRRQPLPGVRGDARLGARRDREQDRSGPGAEGQRLRGRRGRAVPVIACARPWTCGRAARSPRRRSASPMHKHYLNYGRTEQRIFDEVVTDFERRRMFERG